MPSLRKSTLIQTLRLNREVLDLWIRAAEADELPFTDGEEDVEEQPVLVSKLVGDLAVVRGSCDTLVRVLGDDLLD